MNASPENVNFFLAFKIICIMSFQTHKTSFNIYNTNEDIFN